MKGIDPAKQDQIVDDMIKRMNLEKFRHIQCGDYSGGNKRKLSAAIALLGGP